MIQTLAYCTPILLAFACVVAYEYFQRLRADLTNEKANSATAWRLYKAAQSELAAVGGRTPFDPYLPEPQSARRPPIDEGSARFVPTGIGPTAIADRELRREQQEQRARTEEPPFASAATLNPELSRHPTPEAIAAAARAATSNGGNR